MFPQREYVRAFPRMYVEGEIIVTKNKSDCELHFLSSLVFAKRISILSFVGDWFRIPQR
jgi:hypothetical protein